ncbi:hypothetical protein C1I97_05755 [Streptomyces sp. NTH33]|uniref:hypothetical protein n=1 Tax=Streptomyces sp. NTH33 TaxID=1735453 RepID=UPI000DAA75D6|nr:hypothetical protein [Streptomyces sp. NTH33]PZH17010.1 hypothetical protein C1I97_05755 [Streptomyces sp. NTH33]
MCGLTGRDTDPGPVVARDTVQAVSTAVAVLAALALLVSACGTGGTGARDEGPAHVGSAASPAATPSLSPTPRAERMDAVRLIKQDPHVSAAIKRALKPCVADEYPVDVSYGDLTGNSVDDIVVNILTCGDAVGLGAYVYRERDSGYENVFKAEEPPVYAEIDRGDLVVTKQVYARGDPVSSPSIEDVVTYHWSSAGRFVKEFSTRNKYSKSAGSDAVVTPDD